MRRPIITAAIVALVLTACPPSRPTDADEAAIHSVLEHQKEAWNRGDIEGFMRGYHHRKDIVFTSRGRVRRGHAQTLAAYQRKYVAGNAMGHLEFRDVELQPIGPDAAVALGTWELTQTREAAHGVFSLVFTRQQGRWGIVHDHSSVTEEDPPRPSDTQ